MRELGNILGSIVCIQCICNCIVQLHPHLGRQQRILGMPKQQNTITVLQYLIEFLIVLIATKC